MASSRTWRMAARDAADLLVAFMTLESYGLDDLRPARRSASRSHNDAPAGTASGLPDPSWNRGAASDHEVPSDLRHPHRHALRAPDRPRRPGTSTTREQLCLTPVEHTTGASAPDPVAPPRCKAPQDATR